MRLWLVAAIALAGCAGNLHVDPYAPAHGGVIRAGAVPDVRCAGTPVTGKARGFRTLRHRITTALARENHRGFDLIATSTDAQVLTGKLAYGLADKQLDREDVELFACVAGTWQAVGATRTDDRGRFALALEGPARLPVGLRDIYASVVADRSGVRFLAFVAPGDAPLIVSDVDGTLTSSEASFVKAVFVGSDVRPHRGAAASLRAAAARGYQVVYLTARSDRFTDATRVWLGNHGFPRGPVRLAPSLIVKPGSATVAYKQRVLRELGAFEIAAGVGNRKSDVAAYRAAGVPAERIFVKLPEYGGELGASLRAGAAIGFGTYGPLAVP
jgi:phosphatidate phosphatase PAH1